MAFRITCLVQDLKKDMVLLLQASAIACILIMPILVTLWFYGQTF